MLCDVGEKRTGRADSELPLKELAEVALSATVGLHANAMASTSKRLGCGGLDDTAELCKVLCHLASEGLRLRLWHQLIATAH